jgi:hypothetical protein
MEPRCGMCKLRQYAERKPESIIGKIWLWHTKWCPGWKAYQKSLKSENSSN